MRCPLSVDRLLVLAAGGALLLAGCRQAPAAAPPSSTAAAPSADSVVLDAAAQTHAGIVVLPASAVTRTEAVEAPGLVALNEMRTASIGSLVDGVVIDAFAQAGERVKANQVLANLHSHVVHDSWASYRKSIAEVRRLTNEVRFAVDAHARTERLFADKAVALQDVQRALANRVFAEEALDMAGTEQRRAEEELEHLGITNGDDPTGESGEQIPVRSPYAGVVLERRVTPGTAVTTGTPLFVVSDLSTVWVLAEVDEAFVGRVQLGRNVRVHVAAYPGEAFSGTVNYIGETINPKTRRVTVRCQVPNTDGRLKPEMYANVEIGEGDPHELVAVPTGAVQTMHGQSSVFVAEADGRFRARVVDIGSERDGLVEVRTGLRAGERVVTSGAFVLKSELLKTGAGTEN